MDSQKRMLLAVFLSFLLLTVWQVFFAPRAPSTTAGKVDSALDGGAKLPPPTAASPQPAAVTPTAAPPPSGDQPPVRLIERSFSKVHYTVTTEGGGLTKVELQGRKMREQPRLTLRDGFARVFGQHVPPPPQVDMGRPVPGTPFPLAVAVEGTQPFSAATHFRVDERLSNEQVLVLVAESPGWAVTKTFEWPRPGGDLMRLTVALKNTGTQAASGNLAVYFARAVDPEDEEKPSLLGGVGNLTRPICSVAGDVQRVGPDDKPKDLNEGAVDFFGIDQQYFLAAIYPESKMNGRCSLAGGAAARTINARFPVTVAPNQEITSSFGVYVGSKDVEELTKIGASAGDKASGPHLEKTVEFGWFGWMAAISTFLLMILKLFYGVFHNWGVAIICLTIVVKVAMLPLTHKSMMSAEQMKKLQPRMEELRKKFGQDKERQNLEMIKLYQEAKVNPLGGCLPILIQMPVWFALFGALRNSWEIYGEPFIAPIWMDLTYKDPTYILPIALGVTMIVTQRLQPQMTMDKTQALMMTYVMPSVFSLMMLNYPSGLSLYIFTNNLVSIGQQWLLKRYIRHKEGSVPGPTALGRSR